jgi:hypothetical protein
LVPRFQDDGKSDLGQNVIKCHSIYSRSRLSLWKVDTGDSKKEVSLDYIEANYIVRTRGNGMVLNLAIKSNERSGASGNYEICMILC